MGRYLETIGRLKERSKNSDLGKDKASTGLSAPTEVGLNAGGTHPKEYERNEINERTPISPLEAKRQEPLQSPEAVRLSNESTWFDIPFPAGYGGLPRAPVEMAEVVNDKSGINDPVVRKYNVIAWLRGYYQYLDQNHGEHYEALKREQARLGKILDNDITQTDDEEDVE